MKLISLVLLVACCVSLLSSCSNNANEPAAPGLITLKVTLPQDEVYDMDSPASRTGSVVTPEGDESKISALKFFIFDSANALEEYKSITIDDYGLSSDPMWDSVTRTLRITITPGAKKIYCLANWTDNSADGMPAITDANAGTVAALTAQTRTHTNLTPGNPPVMTGSLNVTISGSESGLDISLRRQIARVEFSFKLSDVLTTVGTANVQITGVKFMKLSSASYVFPQSTVISPSGTTVWSQTTFTGVTPLTSLTGAAVTYGRKYYLPEYAPTLATNATTMVIHATYNGTSTYYSLPIDPSGSTNYPHTANVIERNHTYQYTITVEGRGVDNEPTRSVATPTANITYQLEIK